MKRIKLIRQLRQAGASRQEARQLSALTSELRHVLPHLDGSAKQQIAHQIGLHRTPLYAKPRFALVGATAAIIILSIAVQFAQPGSPLYALKRATEEVRVILQPSFKEELQHQRQAEQRQIDDQQRSNDQQRSGGTPSDGSGDSSGRGSSNDAAPINLNDGSGKIDELKVDSSGPSSGSGDIKLPEVKSDNSGRGPSIDTSGLSGSSDGGHSVEGPKL
ncbi:MAG: hypothetical protein ABI716_02355 [Candidatus Saccharibacteria bacterium]